MKQFIKCPECGSIELASIGNYDLVHLNHIHWCVNCGYYINRHEWEQVKALSIKQPWAWLIVNGHKDIENRNTLKNFRGTFLIHAGKTFDKGIDINAIPVIALKDYWGSHKNSTVSMGGIIGYATITDSITKSNSPWFSGPNAFVIEDAHSLPFTPCKGQLGFFKAKID